MVEIAVLLPTNTPAPMMPPMEIIARWRARRDLESFDDAGRETSVAFIDRSCSSGGPHDTPAAPRFATIDRHSCRFSSRPFDHSVSNQKPEVRNGNESEQYEN